MRRERGRAAAGRGPRAKKSLGQNFLVDQQVVDGIMEALDVRPGDRVLEIGPGHGVLTRRLVQEGAEVVAVELDLDLISELETLPIQVIHGDILKVDVGAVFGERGQGLGGRGQPRRPAPNLTHPALSARQPYKVIGNIPYYISSPLLRHVLEAQPRPESVVLMLQEELAERVVAKPGSMSLLSVSVQLYGRPEIVLRVPAKAFRPAPKVDSAVVRIEVYPEPLIPMANPEHFFAVARAGFAERRKQLHNALQRNWKPAGAHTRAALDPAAVVETLQSVGIDPARRAETLTLREWALVAEQLAPSGRLGA